MSLIKDLLVWHKRLGLGKVQNVTDTEVIVSFIFYAPSMVFSITDNELEIISGDKVCIRVADKPDQYYDETGDYK
jgi:transcription elongation factor GreA-like protein